MYNVDSKKINLELVKGGFIVELYYRVELENRSVKRWF